ncbi:MAG: hypothetical protein EA402_00645 [Planctomycetota bacterium]|nr:MAG: hypothetical protein EA402_00645 [Planctomycetota bacterium]
MDGFDDQRLAELIRAGIAALGDYHDDLVLIGGLAPFCYRWLPGYEDMGLSPCGTMDVDLAVESRVAVRGGTTMRQHLEANGFTTHEGPGFDRHPGKQTFSIGPARAGRRGERYIEFIAPLRGRGEDGAPARPQRDLIAERVRFIDLLRARPCPCNVPGVGRILLPHPACYVVQKARIRPYRQHGGKHIKDQADLFLVLWAFSSVWQEWCGVLADLGSENQTWGKWIGDALEDLRKLYLDAEQIGPTDVLRGFSGTESAGLDADAIVRIMRQALRAITPGGSI